MEPTHVGSSLLPYAEWTVPSEQVSGFWSRSLLVRRFHDSQNGDTVTVGAEVSQHAIRVKPEVAATLGAAITAAAQWTDDEVVDAEIIDDRPRYDHRLLMDAVLGSRPSWMTALAIHELALAMITHLHDSGTVVIVRDGEEWAP